MALSKEEEQRIREQVRRELEQRFKNREREEEVRRIREEEERKFYESKGLRRYVNHRGHVEWLTPEEIRRRKKARKVHRHRGSKRRWGWRLFGEFVLALVLIVGVGAAGYYWYRTGPASSQGTIVVRTDVPDVAVFVDGRPFPSRGGKVTGVPRGVHVVSVSKPGYIAVPLSDTVTVFPGREVETVPFALRPVPPRNNRPH
ncbi:MAG TPA: PEGA domain-containing protein [Candidatus Latescibacteria bacterium]|nr:PEGA domain-containing protein [Candidatus Latescibacterota bacterium]